MTTTAVKELEKGCGELSSNLPKHQEWNEDNILPKELPEEFLEETSESYLSMTLEEFCANPPDNTEWVDGQIIKKENMGILHGKLQLRFGSLLLSYLQSSSTGGYALTEVICRTNSQGRKPDVAYISAEQSERLEDEDMPAFPECFALIAEIISPTDVMDAVFAKVREYLESGSLEVWLVLPRQKLIMIASWHELEQDQRKVKIDSYLGNDIATSPRVLQGFSITIDEFFN